MSTTRHDPQRGRTPQTSDRVATSSTTGTDFSLEVRPVGPRTQVTSIVGTVRLPEARRLECGVIDGIRGGRTRVVLDLSGVTVAGPGLLGVLLRMRRGITRIDGRLALVVGGGPVAELVRTTMLSALIEVAPDCETAVALVDGNRRPRTVPHVAAAGARPGISTPRRG